MSKFGVDEYLGAMQALMPRGRVWQSDSDSVQSSVLEALSRSFAQSDTDAIALLVDLFPKTTTGFLTEWEKTLKLPDDCAIGETDTIAKRRTAIVSKLVSTGGQSADYFISVAEAMGYDISITEFRPALCGMSACGDAINGDEWPFVWLITAPETTMIYARAGASYCGDYLRSWGNKLLECRMTKLSPSQTILKIGYEGSTGTSNS